jgi:hypothetical protein
MLDIDRYIPAIDPVNFEAIRALNGSDFPSTYDEWLKLLADQKILRHQRSVRFTEIQVNVSEFTAYCRRIGKAPTMERPY